MTFWVVSFYNFWWLEKQRLKKFYVDIDANAFKLLYSEQHRFVN